MSFYRQKIAKIFDVVSERSNRSLNMGLLGGKTGLSMALMVYSDIIRDEKIKSQGIEMLETVFKEIEQADSYIFSFSNGLSGFGWALEHLEQKGHISHNTNALLEDFDSALSDVLAFEMKKGNYDFLHGALGIILYFISRMPKNENVLPVLQRFVVQLHELAENLSTEWINWVSVVDVEKRTKWVNISLSHGMSSLVVLLSKLYIIKGIDREMVTTLLQRWVNFISMQEIDKDRYGSFFSNYIIENQVSKSRLAWCYGDLGVSMALWQAGVALHNETWKNKALEVLLFAAEKRRDLNENFVIDAGLCHGASGIGHIFYRMWWNTRMPEFKKAADYWFEKTLKMATHTDGLAGYKSWHGEERGWLNDCGLLEGIAGIGLALLTYYHEVEPKWDECLLLS